MRYPMVWRLVVPVAAALLVVGCKGSNPEPSPTATAVAVGDVAEPVWQVRARAMSQPHVKDGVAVAYLAVPDPDAPLVEVEYDVPVVVDQLVVVAWDAATGEELWRHAAVPGSNVRTDSEDYGYGPRIDITELDGTPVVDYLVGDPDSDGTLVATADLRTGKETRYGPAVWANSRPYSCDSDPWRGVCLEGTFAGEADAHEIELDLESGTLVAVPDPAPANPVPAGAEQLNAGLFYLEGQLGYADDAGEVVWTRPYEDVFVPGATPDGLSGWVSRPDGLLVGIGEVSTAVAGEYDASTVMRSVVLSQETGQTVGSAPGLPCTGSWGRSDDIVPVCVETGTVTFPGDGSNGLTYADHGRYVVGLDVATGEQIWRFPAEGDAPVTDDSRYVSVYPYVDADTYLVVRWSGRPQVVDLRTGQATALDDDTSLLCWSPWDHTYTATFTVGGAGSGTRSHGRDVVEVCDLDGMPTEASWPAYFVRAAFFDDEDHDGKDDDGLYVVAGPGQIAAFQL